MIGKKLYKDTLTDEEYAKYAIWCNANRAEFKDCDTYYEIIQTPKPTEEEAKTNRILELKYLLKEADYWGQKYLDGEYTEEEWEIKKATRKAWREEIRKLEE